jgi:hypothetical protein
MSLLTSFADVPNRVFQVPRRLLCLPLPDGFTLPTTAHALDCLTERVGDALGFDELTPICKRLAPGQWMFIFFHGREKALRAATYENGAPGSITYTPRQAAMIVIDLPHRHFYVSTVRTEMLRSLLSALNGTLFPNRPIAMPFAAYRFDLDILPALRQCDRHPASGHYPWQNLSLKSISAIEPGTNASLIKTNWMADGFEYLDLQAFTWPRHPREVSLLFQPADCKNRFTVSFFHNQGILRASLSLRTLPAIGELVNLCSHAGHHHTIME